MKYNYKLEDFFKLLKDVDIDDFIKLVRFSKEMIDNGYEDAIIKAIDAWYINHDVNISCNELFNELSLNDNYLGSIYLKQIILDIINEQYNGELNYKGIFNYIARKNHTTSSRVEKNIRDSINHSWPIINDDIKDKVFPNVDKKPGSLKFILYIIKYQQIHLHNENTIIKKDDEHKKLVLTLD